MIVINSIIIVVVIAIIIVIIIIVISEALDLSSATLKQKEPADAMILDNISDKLEIDEVSTSVCSTVKEDVSSKQNVSDDGAVDINTRLNGQLKKFKTIRLNNNNNNGSKFLMGHMCCI